MRFEQRREGDEEVISVDRAKGFPEREEPKQKREGKNRSAVFGEQREARSEVLAAGSSRWGRELARG